MIADYFRSSPDYSLKNCDPTNETWNNMYIMFYCNLHQVLSTFGPSCDLHSRKHLVPIFSVGNWLRLASLSILDSKRCGQNKSFAGSIVGDVSCASHWILSITLNRNWIASASEPIQIVKNEEMSDWWDENQHAWLFVKNTMFCTFTR